MRSRPHVWRRGALIALLLGWASQAGAQQTGTVTGRVLDETGSPLPVVQVSITDLSVGVLSQQNGTYTLQNVPVGTHALTAQRLGYRVVTQNVTVTAGGAATADFELGQIALALDAVVVTGTAGGTQRRAIGNVVTQVQAAAVTESMPVTNMVEMLGGRAPGLQFNRTTGVVGEGSAIRIRGVGSVTLGSHPLIFIDGIRADNRTNAGPNGSSASALDDINANDIESIEIIKGPAAATLYGTEASEGVIQIITKRGAQGAPQFDFAVHQGIRFMRDPAGQIGTLFGCRSTSSPPCPVADIFEYNPVDEAKWYIDRIHGPLGTSGIYPGGQTEWNEWPCDKLFCNGHLETYTLSIRGGTDNLRYFVSGEFLGDEGVVPWNWQDRTNVRVNLNMLLTPNLSLDVSTGYVSGYTRFADTPSEGDVFDDMQWGKGYCLIRINPDACTRQGGFQERSPGDMWSVENTREWDRFIGSFTAQHIFREFLTQRFIFGIDNTWEINRNYFPLDPVSPPYRNAQAGAIRYDRPNVSNITLDYAASARTQLNDAFSLNTSVGVQYYEHLTETFRNEGRGFALPVQTTVNQTPVSSLSVVYTYVAEQVARRVHPGRDRLERQGVPHGGRARGRQLDVRRQPRRPVLPEGVGDLGDLGGAVLEHPAGEHAAASLGDGSGGSPAEHVCRADDLAIVYGAGWSGCGSPAVAGQSRHRPGGEHRDRSGLRHRDPERPHLRRVHLLPADDQGRALERAICAEFRRSGADRTRCFFDSPSFGSFGHGRP